MEMSTFTWGSVKFVFRDFYIPCQVFMEIRCPDGGDGGRKSSFPATHEEIHPTGMLSVVANLTPWSDHNQSPRNMYQCQVL